MRRRSARRTPRRTPACRSLTTTRRELVEPGRVRGVLGTNDQHVLGACFYLLEEHASGPRRRAASRLARDGRELRRGAQCDDVSRSDACCVNNFFFRCDTERHGLAPVHAASRAVLRAGEQRTCRANRRTTAWAVGPPTERCEYGAILARMDAQNLPYLSRSPSGSGFNDARGTGRAPGTCRRVARSGDARVRGQPSRPRAARASGSRCADTTASRTGHAPSASVRDRGGPGVTTDASRAGPRVRRVPRGPQLDGARRGVQADPRRQRSRPRAAAASWSSARPAHDPRGRKPARHVRLATFHPATWDGYVRRRGVRRPRSRRACGWARVERDGAAPLPARVGCARGTPDRRLRRQPLRAARVDEMGRRLLRRRSRRTTRRQVAPSPPNAACSLGASRRGRRSPPPRREDTIMHGGREITRPSATRSCGTSGVTAGRARARSSQGSRSDEFP